MTEAVKLLQLLHGSIQKVFYCYCLYLENEMLVNGDTLRLEELLRGNSQSDEMASQMAFKIWTHMEP